MKSACVPEQMTFHSHNRMIADAQRVTQIIKVPIRMQEHCCSCLTELHLRHSERHAQTCVPDETAYRCFGNLRSQATEDHPHARRDARRLQFLGIPDQHHSMPCAMASASARWRNTSALGRPAKSPLLHGYRRHRPPERAGCAVGQFNGHMPVERGGIKGRCGRMHGGSNFTVQRTIDACDRLVSSRDGELWCNGDIQVACMPADGLTSLPRCARHHS